MLAKLLTINGLTFDRTRTRLCHGFVTFHAGDEDGTPVASLYTVTGHESVWPGAVAILYAGGGHFAALIASIDAQGRDMERPGREGYAQLLDLAVEAGLQLPEGAEAGNSTL